MTKYDEDAKRRPHGARHPLAGLSEELLEAARRGARECHLDVLEGEEDIEDLTESVLIALRAGGFLHKAPLFTALPGEYDAEGEPTTGGVYDLRHWPHSEDVTEMLFGASSLPWDKAVWAANQLNTDYAVTPEAWAKHCAESMPDEFGPYVEQALQDPEFRQAYESAQKEEGVTEEWKPPTVGDLISKLSTLDPTLPVVLAKDEEGNGFEFWSGDADESLINANDRDATYHTPEQWAEEMAKPDSRFDPVDDEPPEIGGDIQRVIVVWP